MEALQRLHNRGSISTGYDIDNSLKFEEDNLELLYKTFSGEGTGAGRTFTISVWCKRTELGGIDIIFGFGRDANDYGDGGFRINSDQLQLASFPYSGGVDSYNIRSTAVFRDTCAWYHFMAAVDTTQGTASNRVRLYVNGTEITDFTTSDYPAQNFQWKVGRAEEHMIGNRPDTSATEGAGFSTQNFSGYMAEFQFVDGQQLTPTDFGEFDEDTGIWKPKAYTGSYGNNGFYLDFENASSLGADASGNGNNFTLNNITSADQASDTPTNNFCTLRPAYEPTAAITLKEGATVWQNLGNSNSAFQPNSTAIGTFQLTAGKWYWECTWTNDGDRALIGIVASLADIRQTTDWQEWVWWDGYNGWISSSIIATETNPPSFDSINTIGIALDCDNQRITFSKDGGWLEANGNMNGSSPSDWRWDWTNDSDFLGSAYSNGNVTPMFGIQSDFNTHFTTANVNFGGYAATIRTAGGNSDANGYGNFAYAVPSGFYALCTKNLAEFG